MCKTTALLLGVLALAGCAANTVVTPPAASTGGTFADDVAFVQKTIPVITLTDDAGQAQVVVAPALQGRVLTSTANGPHGDSYGWINRELISSGEVRKHINAFGGEDRFWIGPEGGQFSIFFPKGAKFDMANWQTPAPIDTDAFAVISKDSRQATFQHKFTLTNYTGTQFDVHVQRQVRLLDDREAWKDLAVTPAANVKMVAYESVNRLTNAGTHAWEKTTGLLSIWILGMYNATPTAMILVPFRPGPEAQLGKIVESGYFGPIPPDRLQIKDGVIRFRADANFRSKIGVSPKRTTGVLGSYDPSKKVLTIVKFTFDPSRTDYVNSLWKIQEKPFAGDVANAYNDGPNDLGSQMGKFYELESSSPAAALEPGKTFEHVHRTIHLVGEEKDLDPVAQAVLGVHLKDIVGH